jgi:hypothetical protein
VHRDVKPGNILLEKGVERAVLTDFGLARAADDKTLTRWGIVAGTPQYMSPEQARGEPLDGRSDLFSLGCVLYEMATGVSPFHADSALATLRRLVDEAPRAIGSLNPELPPWFIVLVNRLLEKDPSRRLGSAREVSDLLEACLAHLQQPAQAPLPPVLRGQRRVFGQRFVGVLTMLALLGIGLFGFVVFSADPPDIAGEWSSDEWGRVVLEKSDKGDYAGTYSDTFGKQPGRIELKWSRVERRFNGAWREGEDRFGELSVRLVGDEIRGAHTTDAKSKINPGTPRLADLTWVRPQRSSGTRRMETGALSHRVPFEIGATYLRGGDRITIDEVRGTADAVATGNMYEIKGTYRLASRDKATLAVYVTDDASDATIPRPREAPTQKTQSITVERGEGRFALILYVWQAGKPHVSFYPESGAEGFGHVYFGTGDSVLKKGWWESSPGGAASGNQLRSETAPATALQFSQAVELVLSMDSSKFMLDFDTGQTMDPPATFRPETGRMDVCTTQVQPYHYPTGLIGLALQGLEVKPSDWNASASEVRRALANDGLQPLTQMDTGPEANPTYFFKTRDGAQGILQLQGVVDNPKGVRLRYKTIQTAQK